MSTVYKHVIKAHYLKILQETKHSSGSVFCNFARVWIKIVSLIFVKTTENFQISTMEGHGSRVGWQSAPTELIFLY
jgi:hypothetical protein